MTPPWAPVLGLTLFAPSASPWMIRRVPVFARRTPGVADLVSIAAPCVALPRPFAFGLAVRVRVVVRGRIRCPAALRLGPTRLISSLIQLSRARKLSAATTIDLVGLEALKST
jgi:hypothetical protein